MLGVTIKLMKELKVLVEIFINKFNRVISIFGKYWGPYVKWPYTVLIVLY